MNQQPPGHDESDEVDDLYRRASALDSSRPSESVRKAVLAHAARIAEERASPRANRTGVRSRVRWRPAVFGTLAAAALAGLMIAPRFFAPSAPAPATAPALKAVPSRESAPAAPSVGALAEPPAAALESPAAAPPVPAAGAFGRSPGAGVPVPSAGALDRAPAGAPPAPSADASAAESSPVEAPIVASVSAPADAPAVAGAPTQPGGGAQVGAPPPAQASVSAQALAGTSALAGTPALRATAPKPEAKRSQYNSNGLAEVTVTGARRGPEDQTLAEVVSVGASPTEFRRAAEKGDLPGLQRLLKMGVDIDSRDSLGRTALMLATLGSHAKAVDVLLDNGADPNVADNRGTTPLQAAKAAHAPAIVAALERKGASAR